MHIVHLITWLKPGGIENWLVSFVRQTESAGIKHTIVCRSPDQGILATDAREAGATVISCPILPGLFSYKRRLEQLFADVDADIIHLHTPLLGPFAIRAAKNRHLPVVSTFHNTRFDTQTASLKPLLLRVPRNAFLEHSLRYTIAQSTICTGVSQSVVHSLEPYTKGKNNVRLAYLGVPSCPPIADEVKIREQFQWRPADPIVAFLGRLLPVKNVLNCVEIMKRLAATNDRIRMVIIGDGEQRAELEAAVASSGLNDRIKLFGFVRNGAYLLSQCQVLLIPSSYEGLGLSAIEAAARGLPCVGSRIPGLNEAVIDGQTGFLHPPNDLAAMAKSVNRLLGNRSEYESFSQRAREHAEQHFSEQACRSNIIDVYREAMQTQRSASS